MKATAQAFAFDDDSLTEVEVLPPLRAPLKFGERLVREKIITPDQLHIALHEQAKTRLMLGATLIGLGFLDQESLAKALARHAGVSFLPLDAIAPDLALLENFSPHQVRRAKALPLSLTGKTLTVALADPFDLVAIDEVHRAFPLATTLSLCVSSQASLDAFLDSLTARADSLYDLLHEIESTASPAKAEAEHPVIRLVDHLLAEAIRQGASDIHFEPEESFVRVRYRIDGRLRQIRAIHLTHWPALSHRLKIMAGMNIADTRSIQDGRFQKQQGDSVVDCRVAIMPTVWGETIVVRLLDHKKSLLPLESLGYSAATLVRLQAMTDKPQGITLVTGPTGSGKTTTLYSMLKKISTPDVHIATLEEPVEYQLELIRQTSLTDGQNLDFAAGVRGILRMDPDIILIGEIRDPETAQMALRAAMTGHQVYTTLHSNDALGTLPRLIDLGLNPRVLSGNLSGLIAQRLVRTLCPHCRHEREATPEEQGLFSAFCLDAPQLTEAEGCEACGHTGRMGRSVIAEALPITPALDDLIAAKAPRAALLDAARRESFVTMQQDGLRRVMTGDIALDDLRRAVDLTRGRP
ncbi:MAG: GspE/PulE family protein [Bdellovibrionales bacterium]